MNFTKRCALIAGAAFLIPAALLAQTTGALRGQVTDPSGAAIPNASVTLTGPNNSVKVAQTDNSGNYTVNGLAAGQYTVRVMAPGFTLFEKNALDLAVGRANTLDIPLSVQVEKQEVTVADTQQITIDPDKNVGALVLKGEDLDILPDDPDDLQADLLALAGPAAGPNGGQIFVDGFSNGQLPPKDSIREIRINSNPFSAEYDASGYGRVEIFTKAGTDKMHAMVQLNYGDSIWNARNPYSTNKPYYNTQNLNANISGSFFKKMSVFLDFERRANKNSSAIKAQQVNPATCLSPVTQAEDQAGSPAGCPYTEYSPSIIMPNMLYRVSPRISYALTPNFTLDGRYNYNNTSISNNGVGGTNLLSTGTTNKNTNQNIAITGTWVVNAAAINETRFQWQHVNNNAVGVDPVVNISVADAFTTGANAPLTYSHNNTYEFQNYTSITHKTHFIKYGARLRGYLQNNYSENNFLGQFNWSSLVSYQNFLAEVNTPGMTLPGIFALENGTAPVQFTQAQGIPLVGVHQVDAGLYVQDDWRVVPSVTLSLGLRYEIQDNIGDKNDWAPRIGLAWGIGKGQGRQKTPNTVLRLGYGWFYTRFPIGDTLNDTRFNGTNQVSYTQNNPLFLTAAALTQIGLSSAQIAALGGGIPIPTGSALAALAESATTYHTDPNLHAPVQMQTAVGVDRSLPKNMQLSVNYINTRGVHQFQTVDINTPFIGTYVPPIGSTPAQGTYPFNGQLTGYYNQYESGGIFKQNQLIFNVRAPINSRVSLQGYYAYGHASADAASPSNPHNFAEDWGRAPYDIHHRVQIEGTVTLPWKLRLNPNISYQSAPPFNITQGYDAFGDSLSNTRPAFEPAGYGGPGSSTLCTSALATPTQGKPCIANGGKYGNFVVNPICPESGKATCTPGELYPGLQKLVPINYGNAFSQFTVNMRLSRTWGFGERLGSNNQRQPQGGQNGQPGGGGRGGGHFNGGGGGRGGGGGGGGGGRGGGGGGGDSSGQKYTLTAGIVARNIFNTVNPAAPVSDLLSNRFDQAISLANIGGGNISANRRLEFNLRFSF
jgi:hypothetical protein